MVPVYILDDETPKHRTMGAASRWWLHHSLAAFSKALEGKGSRLILRRGRSEQMLVELAKEVGASRVHALHHYEPWWRNSERAVGGALDLVLHDGNYLAPPGSVTTGAGQPYKIFTPFWRALRERLTPPEPLPAPERLDPPAAWPESEKLGDWGLLPSKPDWATGFGEEWTPGEVGGEDRLQAFVDIAARYEGQRNLPSVDGTSRLSPHLHFGEISPATVWHGVADAGGSVDTFLGELGWRASFLVKHLLLDWRRGEQWFWDTLVDADYGSNANNWQWVAGSGIDANMFSRIMAPLVQSEKFDTADYIRRWVPELVSFDDAGIHDPPDDRRGAYPRKIIGHREARERALAALALAKRG